MTNSNTLLLDKMVVLNISNDYAILQEVFGLAKNKDDIKLLMKGNIMHSIDCFINEMPSNTKISCLKYFLDAEKSNIDVNYTERIINEVLNMLSVNCNEIRSLAFKLLSKILGRNTKAVKFINTDRLIIELATTFNRKTHKLVVEEAIRCLSPLFRTKHKEKAFQVLKSGLVYCLNHVDSALVLGALKAINQLAAGDCAMISFLIQQNIVDQVYNKFSVPENSVKTAQFKFFSSIATCCSEHLYYTSLHNINEHIPEFICHSDEKCCMSCLDFLQNLHVPVQTALDNKYVLNLVLHVEMSYMPVQEKAYDILKEYINKANPSEISKLVDEGFIRPFCKLMVASEDPLAIDICLLLLKLVEKYNILSMKAACFDFEHGHNRFNESSVERINRILEREDPALKSSARELLSHLKRHDIVLHLPNE